jgi:2-oxoglutarate dehydrogenase E2 component (dihydrolipoamide succinyltransferase)
MTTKIVVPELGESVLEATLGQWAKKEGDPVSVGEVLVSLETDKVDLEVGAEKSGVLAHIERHQGDDVKIGDVLGVIEDAPATTQTTAAQTRVAPRLDDHATAGAAAVAATPSARQLARERGVDLVQVAAAGDGSRVTKEDVEAYAEKAPPQSPPPAPESPPPSPIPESQPPASGPRTEERVRMSRRRQTIARRLVEAQHAAAMLTTFNEIDMTAVMDLRRRHKESFQARYGVGLGLTSFFVKAAVAALKEFPRLNAEVQGDEMVLKHYYDIGVAIGAPDGLVVPILRDADRMSFAQIEQAIKDYARKARERTLSIDDLRGGTFSITNGGVFGSLLSTPILNPPQVGILGLHKIEERPVSREGSIVSRAMMYVALSYDHRIVDGLEAVQFLVRVKEFVEEPASLLLET